jgi:hypothetical protein
MMDSGLAAVAAAEEMAFGGTRLDVRLDRVVVERAFADVVGGPWWQSCGPPVSWSRPRRDAHSSSTRDSPAGIEVRLVDEQLTLATVAHELAHALAGVDCGHGVTFRAAYVDVVAVVAGAEPARALAEALAALDVAAGGRAWPAPYRAAGDGFVVTPA